MKIASVVAQQKCKTLKAVAVGAVCATVRLIPPANHYMRCRLRWSRTSVGHAYRAAVATVQTVMYSCSLPTKVESVLARVIRLCGK